MDYSLDYLYLKDERIPLKDYCKQFSLIVIIKVIDNMS